MRLGFEESQASYNSGSQNARALTEAWASTSLFCPACGNDKLTKFENNRPVADFYCARCNEEYELKSQKQKFGKKVTDGAYGTLTERLSAANNPNFAFLQYDLGQLRVTNLFIVPKHFFVPEIIERRKPLASTAKRAGWIGCNILLEKIPEAGKIYIVRNDKIEERTSILKKWSKTAFLKNENQLARGWLLEVMKCVDQINQKTFSINDVYSFEGRLHDLYPYNQNIRPKIRQQLQRLRDHGYITFLGRGNYELVTD